VGHHGLLHHADSGVLDEMNKRRRKEERRRRKEVGANLPMLTKSMPSSLSDVQTFHSLICMIMELNAKTSNAQNDCFPVPDMLMY